MKKHPHYDWRNGVFESIHTMSDGRMPQPHKRWPYMVMLAVYAAIVVGSLALIVVQSVKAAS